FRIEIFLLDTSSILTNTAFLSAWIDRARQEEWRQVPQTNRSTIEGLKALSGKPENLRGRTWPELVDQLLAFEPQLIRDLQLDTAVRRKLEPLWKIACDIVDRRSAIGFLGPSRESTSQQSLSVVDIIRKLGTIRNPLENGSVSFIRLLSGSNTEGIDTSDKAFDDLMREVMSQLTPVPIDDHAPKEGPRLLVGETGAGKSEMARALHQKLKTQLRRSGEFVHENIAAVSLSLLESRLRGYLKGSFTGAIADQKGWFELAHNGTLFLDEIQAAPKDFQVQLLDLLSCVSDTVEVERIGTQGGTRKRFRVRVIMATNESEASLLDRGLLRKDLAYRIRARMTLPPLKERLQGSKTNDLLFRLLRLHRWRSASAIEIEIEINKGEIATAEDELGKRLDASFLPPIDDEALRLLKYHGWPGNLREFERVCFDAFLEYDRTGSTDWEITFRDAIKKSLEELPPKVPTGDAERSRIVKEIEALLVEAEFNVSAVQNRLAPYKKKSPLALKSFLRANASYLDERKWTSHKAKLLLGRPCEGQCCLSRFRTD
ncbi:MAG: sigma 54-interacting transcriptional regulator, partial [Burkholderiaceae bacterium]